MRCMMAACDYAFSSLLHGKKLLFCWALHLHRRAIHLQRRALHLQRWAMMPPHRRAIHAPTCCCGIAFIITIKLATIAIILLGIYLIRCRCCCSCCWCCCYGEY